MDIKNYAVEPTDLLIEQINELSITPAYNDSKIRIMPDGHPGKGAVIGSTITYTDKIVPNTVGVDIACRVSLFKIPCDINLEKLDKVIHEHIPCGFSVRAFPHSLNLEFHYEMLRCWTDMNNKERIKLSLGTLGGGNHYISVDENTETGEKYLCIHTGSRNLGKQVCEYYQAKAKEYMEELKSCIYSLYNKIIKEYCDMAKGIIPIRKGLGETIDLNVIIPRVIENRNKEIERLIPRAGLEYISDDVLEDYIHDMEMINKWSLYNHLAIAMTIGKELGFDIEMYKTCIHNYVDTKNNIIRKGAISAYKDEIGIIPLNMRDGVLVVRGKGNEDWNCSLPHGAGRLMGRGEARKQLTMEDFSSAMENIYTSCIDEKTLDESPMAYKDAAAIIKAIEPNAEIVAHLQEIYNFKSLD